MLIKEFRKNWCFTLDNIHYCLVGKYFPTNEDLKMAVTSRLISLAVQGFYIIIAGMALLHFHEEKWPDNKKPLAGGELFPDMDAMGTGYVIVGLVEVAINIGLLFNTEKSKPMIKWPMLSIVCTGFYTYLVIYQLVQYEVHKTKGSPFAEFVLFIMPLLGEVLHWFAIHIVRCFYKDMEYNYDKYREIPIRPFKGIVFYKVDP